jgi:beta-glucanase (GH16 family)
MKHLLLFLVIVLCSIAVAQNPIEKDGWELTFNDEFNGEELDYTKWQDHYYWGGRFNKDGITYYAKNQYKLTGSTISFIADAKDNEANKEYRSFMLDSSPFFKQQYGYFEIRSKNPKGTGFWPAFWLVSTEEWPPEIDIYEFYTNEPNRIKMNQHWLNKRGKKHMQPKGYMMKEAASDDFHTYAVDWSRKKIIWYLDGKKIKTSRRGMRYLKYKMHMIINNEVSRTNDMDMEKATIPNYFEVDYVRVYKRK